MTHDPEPRPDYLRHDEPRPDGPRPDEPRPDGPCLDEPRDPASRSIGSRHDEAWAESEREELLDAIEFATCLIPLTSQRGAAGDVRVGSLLEAIAAAGYYGAARIEAKPGWLEAALMFHQLDTEPAFLRGTAIDVPVDAALEELRGICTAHGTTLLVDPDACLTDPEDDSCATLPARVGSGSPAPGGSGSPAPGGSGEPLRTCQELFAALEEEAEAHREGGLDRGVVISSRRVVGGLVLPATGRTELRVSPLAALGPTSDQFADAVAQWLPEASFGQERARRQRDAVDGTSLRVVRGEGELRIFHSHWGEHDAAVEIGARWIELSQLHPGGRLPFAERIDAGVAGRSEEFADMYADVLDLDPAHRERLRGVFADERRALAGPVVDGRLDLRPLDLEGRGRALLAALGLPPGLWDLAGRTGDEQPVGAAADAVRTEDFTALRRGSRWATETFGFIQRLAGAWVARPLPTAAIVLLVSVLVLTAAGWSWTWGSARWGEARPWWFRGLTTVAPGLLLGVLWAGALQRISLLKDVRRGLIARAGWLRGTGRR